MEVHKSSTNYHSSLNRDTRVVVSLINTSHTNIVLLPRWGTNVYVRARASFYQEFNRVGSPIGYEVRITRVGEHIWHGLQHFLIIASHIRIEAAQYSMGRLSNIYEGERAPKRLLMSCQMYNSFLKV